MYSPDIAVCMVSYTLLVRLHEDVKTKGCVGQEAAEHEDIVRPQQCTREDSWLRKFHVCSISTACNNRKNTVIRLVAHTTLNVTLGDLRLNSFLQQHFGEQTSTIANAVMCILFDVCHIL